MEFFGIQVRSPRGSKRPLGVAVAVAGAGFAGGMGEGRRAVGMSSPVGNALQTPREGPGSGVGVGVVGVRKGPVIGGKDRDKGYSTPNENRKVQSPDTFSPTGVRSPRHRNRYGGEYGHNPSAVFPYSGSNNCHSSNHHGSNNNSDNNDSNTKRDSRQDVKLHFTDSTENSDVEFESSSVRRKELIKGTEGRREGGGVEPPGRKEDVLEIILTRNKVDARKLYEKRISREERSKVHRNQPSVFGAAEDSEGEYKSRNDQMDVVSGNGNNNGNGNGNGNGEKGPRRDSVISCASSNIENIDNHNSDVNKADSASKSDKNSNKSDGTNSNNSIQPSGHPGIHGRPRKGSTDDGLNSEVSASEVSDIGGDEEKSSASRAKNRPKQVRTVLYIIVTYLVLQWVV